MRKSLPVMTVPSGPEQRADGPYVIWGAVTPDQRQLDHAPVSLAAGSGQLVLRERGEDNAGLIVRPTGDHARKREPSSSSALYVRTPKHPRRCCRDRQHPTGIRTGAPARTRRRARHRRVAHPGRRCRNTPAPPRRGCIDPGSGLSGFPGLRPTVSCLCGRSGQDSSASKSRAPRSEAGLTPTCAGSDTR